MHRFTIRLNKFSLIIIRTYLKLKDKEDSGAYDSVFFLVSFTVKFPTYDICPCNMHESRYKFVFTKCNSVFEVDQIT
jgi:hypothetical protein